MVKEHGQCKRAALLLLKWLIQMYKKDFVEKNVANCSIGELIYLFFSWPEEILGTFSVLKMMNFQSSSFGWRYI